MAIAGINISASQHGGALPPKPRSGAPPSSGPCALCVRRCVPSDGASGGPLLFGQEVRVEDLDFGLGWAWGGGHSCSWPPSRALRLA